MRIEMARPDLLYLLVLLPLWTLLLWPRVGRGFRYTGGVQPGRRARFGSAHAAVMLAAPRLLTAGAFAAIVIALAEPERVEVTRETILEGHGIGLVIDLSSSMLAEDMGEGRSRIEVA